LFDRRQLLFKATQGSILAAFTGAPQIADAANSSHARELLPPFFNVRNFGATGDGKSIDSPAINKALEAAAAMGGGTVYVPAGTYNCYSLRLKSFICLYIEQGATILAAPTPLDGTTTDGYDAAEPQGPWEPYQDYGHNHWHTSLIWGEAIHDFSIMGPGLIWGKGLSRGHQNDKDLPDTTKPGVRNKTIALKNCFNVTLRDFSIFKGGWFGILATGVDNYRGRDAHYCAPPAQIPAGAIRAPGSHLGCLTAKRTLGHG
jgi:polygalacturonase